jgi:phage terminase small subunit
MTLEHDGISEVEKDRERGLTHKQEMFCQEYLVDSNATKAAIRAGYSERNADKIGSELLGKTRVANRVDELCEERLTRLRITSDYVLSNIVQVIERCLQREPVMVREGRQMVQLKDEEDRHVWKFDAAGANKALETLAKHKKLLTDRVEHSGVDGKPIEHKSLTEIPDDQLDAKIKAMIYGSEGPSE